MAPAHSTGGPSQDHKRLCLEEVEPRHALHVNTVDCRDWHTRAAAGWKLQMLVPVTHVKAVVFLLTWLVQTAWGIRLRASHLVRVAEPGVQEAGAALLAVAPAG